LELVADFVSHVENVARASSPWKPMGKMPLPLRPLGRLHKPAPKTRGVDYTL